MGRRHVVVTSAQPPFDIVHVNDAWCALCGFAPEDVVGKTLRVIQGPQTDAATVRATMAALRARNAPVEMTLTNYKSGGVAFANRAEIEPVCDATGAAVYMVGRLTEVAAPAHFT